MLFGFWKRKYQGDTGAQKEPHKLPTEEVFYWVLVPPHQFCKPGTAKAERLNDSFPSCSRCRAPQPLKPSHRHVPTQVGAALVCATARGRALGTIPGNSHTDCYEHCCWDPSSEPVGCTRTREYNSGTAALALPLNLWPLRHLPKLLMASLIHLVQIVPSATLVPTIWSLNPENFTLLAVSGPLLGGAEGENPLRHQFFYRNSGQSLLFISVGSPLDER